MALESLTVLALFALAVLPALPAQSHVGDRVYPIYQLTDEMVERIDVRDGSVDEWMDLEPSLTLLDFGLIPGVSDITERDPADLDFRIWLGWVPSPSRIHVAALVADDFYYNDYDPEDPDEGTMSTSDSITLRIDADHSGGPWSWIPDPGADAEKVLEASNAQWYDALSEAPGNVTLGIRRIDGRGWPVLPPFGDGGGSVWGENPVFWVVEFYVTPFARFDYEDQQASDTFELVPGAVVGFHLTVIDQDAGGWEGDAHYALPVDAPDSIIESLWNADIFVDGLLVGFQEESAVRADSWGRIKASLAE